MAFYKKQNGEQMKRLVLGILAHVDAGKTTLSEGLLYAAGAIRKMGRVDHGNAFLDTETVERARGITVFSKQAMLETDTVSFTLLDTPGHVDFSAEMERTLRVLDYAVLVISGADGLQSHTETLWKLLKHYQVPTFLFVNKMDLPTADRKTLLEALRTQLDEGCLSFSEQDAAFCEQAAVQDAPLLDAYLEMGTLSDSLLCDAIFARKLFPVYFGSALKHEGVEDFFDALCRYTKKIERSTSFGAKVFKIAEDEKGQRLTYLKITGGNLPVKTILKGKDWTQKVNEIRIYSGQKFESVLAAEAGSVCAVPGLEGTYPGEGLGAAITDEALLSVPVLTYSVVLPEGVDALSALAILRKLEEEETELHVVFRPQLSKIDVQVMGEVQLEILKEILRERFGISVSFDAGSILYKETIMGPVEGVGHFEPLRHYAEVHLLLEPLPRGKGLLFETNCSTDELAGNWQQLVLTHLAEKTHLGVLTGAPITDMKITLVAGRAHIKHTEGGDFRQATYRAVRQGLMQAESILLEPWYAFVLEIPSSAVGRAMTDLQRMGAVFAAPEILETEAKITGRAPVSSMRAYQSQMMEYTRGHGRLSCTFDGYDVCPNAEEVIAKRAYDAEGDVENTADSVFCAHGAGVLVRWNEVPNYMHLPTMAQKKETTDEAPRPRQYQKGAADDETLLAIYERTYGKIRQRTPGAARMPKVEKPYQASPVPTGPTYLLVDGYNIIFAWEALSAIAKESLETARSLLIQRLCNYQAMRKNRVIVVFDAYRVPGSVREIETVCGISVVYTKEAETADAYIEKTTKELVKHYRVRVATADRLEQIIVFGHGTQRVSATEFEAEVLAAEAEMRAFIQDNA